MNPAGLLRPTYASSVTATRIDHMFSSDPSQFQYDHAAMIASVAITPHQKYNTRWILPLQQLRKGQFDASLQTNNSSLATIPVSTHTDPAATIKYYVDESVQRIKALFGVHTPNRGKGTRYWCPNNVALDIILRMVVQLRRL